MITTRANRNRSEQGSDPRRAFIRRFYVLPLLLMLAMAILGVSVPERAQAQQYDPPYPRINMLIWGGASPAWYAEFDWAIVSWGERNRARMMRAKAMNPDLVVSGTHDVNCCECYMPDRAPCPDEWRVKAPNGGNVDPYGTPSITLGNTSETCGLYEGRTFTDAVVEHAMAQDWTSWNGWNSDGLWGPVTWLELDLNRDGVQDGADLELWRTGRLELLNRLRTGLGEETIITAWAGAAETFWDEGPTYLNGVGVEEFMRYQSWHKIDAAYETYFRNGRDRRFFYIANSWLMDPTPNASAPENFQYMRFGLSTTLLRDGFYSYTPEQANHGSGHMWVQYYDEYDVPLGYPLGDAINLEDGVFCRFFDGGVMLLNVNESDRVIEESQLIAAAEGAGLSWDEIAGEDGHYYRFSGQQNPTENDGSLATQITLRGEPAHWGRPRGDGVLLVRSPNLVVAAAVIIDTEKFSTSPSAHPAVVEGFTGSCGEGERQGFRVGYGACSSVNPFYGFRVSAAGENSEAVFEANLAHDGPYRVY